MKRLVLSGINASCKLSAEEKRAVLGGAGSPNPDLTNCKVNERLCECGGIISCVPKHISCSHPTQVLCGMVDPREPWDRV